MRTTNVMIILASTLVLAACGDESGPDDSGDDVGDDVDDGPTELARTYDIDSYFRFADGLPEDEFGGIVKLIAMTDDADDPARWVLDQMEDELDGPIEDLFEVARKALDLDEQLNQELEERSPGLLEDLRALGADMSDLAKQIGLSSELSTSRDSHEITGATFYVGRDHVGFDREELGLDTMRADDVDVALKRGKVTIGSHAIELAYGALLNFGVDEVVVPRHDADAESLREMVADMIDCDAVGRRLDDKLHFGSKSLFKAACKVGVYAALDDLDQPFGDARADLEIAGTATAVDADDDRVFEELADGVWTGSLVFDAAAISLSDDDQPFSGLAR